MSENKYEDIMTVGFISAVLILMILIHITGAL